MEMNNDDVVMVSMSESSDWSTSDDSDLDELLQDDDVKMMSLLIDVHSFEDRAKLMDQRRGSKMGRVTFVLLDSNIYCCMLQHCCNHLNDYCFM